MSAVDNAGCGATGDWGGTDVAELLSADDVVSGDWLAMESEGSLSVREALTLTGTPLEGSSMLNGTRTKQ